jgi:pyrimidine operon attenuation protein/uracil phosphoribosyltransferase
MTPTETTLVGPDGFGPLLADLADQIVADLRPGVPLRLVGVRSRGVPIAKRIADLLADRLGPVPVGALDITLYRDDLDRADRWPILKGTEIPFGIDGAEIVLVDDVLYTGRTIRAALDTICDLGRPSCVRLAVLVDRGHRELPIQADYVGLAVVTAREERVKVRVRPVDATEEVVRVTPPRRP